MKSGLCAMSVHETLFTKHIVFNKYVISWTNLCFLIIPSDDCSCPEFFWNKKGRRLFGFRLCALLIYHERIWTERIWLGHTLFPGCGQTKRTRPCLYAFIIVENNKLLPNLLIFVYVSFIIIIHRSSDENIIMVHFGN